MLTSKILMRRNTTASGIRTDTGYPPAVVPNGFTLERHKSWSTGKDEQYLVKIEPNTSGPREMKTIESGSKLAPAVVGDGSIVPAVRDDILLTVDTFRCWSK